MNYRHLYHAGSLADVFKHLILLVLIKAFLKKEAAFCYIDTHAGTACYDLASPDAQKTKEYELGIGKILVNPKYRENQNISDYLKIIQKLNKQKKATNPVFDKIQFYPGSPLLVRNLLRPQDKMILSELHPDDYKLLKQEFAHDKQVAVHHLDGYLTLKAFLPPQENRGLVLIDPSYEKTDEFQQIIAGLQIALERWRGGTYVIWYPIKTRELVKNFINSIKQLQQKFKIETILNPELEYFANEIPEQLNGCGMLIINPPWKSAQEIIAIKNLLQQKSINDKLD